MKLSFVIVTSLVLIISCSKKEVNVSKTVQSGGFIYEVNETKPFSGIVVEFYENGQKKFEHTFRKGKSHGMLTHWYENGRKKREGSLNDDGQEGKWTYWNENGEVIREEYYRDGELIESRQFK